jgi:hypothetical protein
MVKSRSRMTKIILLLAAEIVAFAVLQGCSSSTSFSTSSAGNPAPGVVLQAIKISPSTPLLALASSRQLFALGTYNDGSTLDLTSQVTWSTSSTTIPPITPIPVSVSSSGVVTGEALGPGAVTATLNGVVGLMQLTVNSDGYTSNTLAILTVPYKNTEIDVLYQPHSLTQTQGVYTVEEVNLDADQFTSQLPVPAAVMASIPMPAGYVPNATIANGSSALVAVFSYSSPKVLVIDASNLASDGANNTVISTFTAPISGQVTFNESFNGTANPVTCTICAGVFNPLDGQLLLSTAQGYWEMNFTTGAFTQLSFAAGATAFPAPGFALNPETSPPSIVSPTFGQDPQFTNEVQVLNLPGSSGPGTVTTYTNWQLTQPNAVAIDLLANQNNNINQFDVAVVDAGGNDQAAVNLGSGQSFTSSSLIGDLSLCTGQGTSTSPFNMVALGTAPNIEPSNVSPTLFLSQPGGNCVGFEIWPSQNSEPFVPLNLLYGYGNVPNTPDGNLFLNGNDPNTIATFTSVVTGTNYGVLVDANQNWIAKLNLTGTKSTQPGILTEAGGLNPPPLGLPISSEIMTAGLAQDPIIFLPAPDSVAILSLNTISFGAVSVGTTSPQILVTLTNVGQNLLSIDGVSITGSNANQFAYTTSCFLVLNPASNCAIDVTFTPTGTNNGQPFSACLNVTDNGGQSPQQAQLSGCGGTGTCSAPAANPCQN